MAESSPITGHRRDLRNRKSVQLADTIAGLIIRVGGVGTLFAVLLICGFLLKTVWPLFRSPEAVTQPSVPQTTFPVLPVAWTLDKTQQAGWFLLPDGSLRVLRMDNGAELGTGHLSLHDDTKQPLRPTALSFNLDGADMRGAFGYKDGRISYGRLVWNDRLYSGDAIPVELKNLPLGSIAEFAEPGSKFGKAIARRINPTDIIVTFLKAELEAPIEPKEPAGVVQLDYLQRNNGPIFAILREKGSLTISEVTKESDFSTGEDKFVESAVPVPYTPPEGKGAPDYVLLAGSVGENLYLLWKDGTLQRFDRRGKMEKEPKLVETVNVLNGATTTIAVVRWNTGRGTLFIGDEQGTVRGWFRAVSKDAPEKLYCGIELPGTGAAVTAIEPASRSRCAVVATADGLLRMFQTTARTELLRLQTPQNQPARSLALSVRDDALVAITPSTVARWSIDIEHADATAALLFGKVWYEGFDKPKYEWQPSGSSDASEPKYSVIPMVFGTLKGAFYSLLIAVPLALLAAIYTSEFMTSGTKAIVKPVIEMMAGLPSVVLGVLAALVFAPFVESWLTAMLAAFITIPGALFLGAYAWQALPVGVRLNQRRLRLFAMMLVIPLGGLAAIVAGPILETILFGGDIFGWLNGAVKNPIGGWIVLCWPIALVSSLFLKNQFLDDFFAKRFRTGTNGQLAIAEASKMLLALLVSFALAYLFAALPTALGLDTRGSLVGGFAPRNALVVGVVMGFAIIPIIYTLAEDALSSVPNHLRAASLGCGATPWQTARLVVVPVAMSGLFTAVMIGMGRAVGETMIVLLAAGNSPIMDVNIFNGFRTLSMVIASEMNEAEQGSSHYRILVLCGLLLFAFTFVINTLAEIVRARFRKRAVQL